MSNTEQPDYKLIISEGKIEIRDYPPMIFAETKVTGQRKEAMRGGFKILADYIFGNNTSAKKIKKKTPLISELSEKIAMTAPVMQEKYRNSWKVKFIMPKKYSLATLPKPNSKKIRLFKSRAKRFAVIRFSGFASDKNIKRHKEELRDYILAEKRLPTGGFFLAFYNPPWTLPFLRRNEIMIEIKPR